ncbi:MAG TPA: 4Fe-4S dicluster domain-containing protein [Anaerolineaceae bacterium]|nr:4Fe-4S dicluster domain-containing protein [Anaerolineaceae bacterium]
MAKILMIYPEKCTGCLNCSEACSYTKEGRFRSAASRVHVYTWEREGISVPMMCQQCNDAPCVSVCPTGAMHRNTGELIVQYDLSKCIRCRMCVQACPFGNAVYDSVTDAIIKCDHCQGKPACAAACPVKALEYVDESVSTRTRSKAFAQKFKEAFQEVA